MFVPFGGLKQAICLARPPTGAQRFDKWKEGKGA